MPAGLTVLEVFDMGGLCTHCACWPIRCIEQNNPSANFNYKTILHFKFLC